MNSVNDTGVDAGPASAQTSHSHRTRRLLVTGSLATLAAMAATTLTAALAQAVGVDFEVPEGGETIPLPGFAVVTGLFSVVGVVIAVALLRWSARPAESFVWAAVALTAISLAAPLLSGANTATTIALIGLHLVAATVMIPTLARSLRSRTDWRCIPIATASRATAASRPPVPGEGAESRTTTYKVLRRVWRLPTRRARS
ncbi:DUF6069 family protein [Angustibacter sp. McL0619]|uniref:DUF6069 family protein n=1 Tax=Angustibacter sp. McL0619 TaxID=3415676 RepID=UPI003CF0AE8C